MKLFTELRVELNEDLNEVSDLQNPLKENKTNQPDDATLRIEKQKEKEKHQKRLKNKKREKENSENLDETKIIQHDDPNMLDHLMYSSYEAQRKHSPEIHPHRWKAIFGNAVERFEKIFQSRKIKPPSGSVNEVTVQDKINRLLTGGINQRPFGSDHSTVLPKKNMRKGVPSPRKGKSSWSTKPKKPKT